MSCAEDGDGVASPVACMGLLHQSGKAGGSEAGRTVDREISRLFALMNPDGRAEPLSDPQREEFLLWSGCTSRWSMHRSLRRGL